jgi:hypothetical protein
MKGKMINVENAEHIKIISMLKCDWCKLMKKHYVASVLT